MRTTSLDKHLNPDHLDLTTNQSHDENGLGKINSEKRRVGGEEEGQQSIENLKQNKPNPSFLWVEKEANSHPS